MEIIGEFQSAMKQYFLRDVLLNENYLSKIGTMVTGVIPGNDKVGLVSRPGYLEGEAASCNPTYKAGGSIDDVEWDIAKVILPYKWCADDVEAELKRNQELYDLTANDAMMKIIKDWMTNALVNNSLALGLFGDKTSSKTELQLTDGIIKRAIAAGNRTTIASGDQTMANMIAGMTAVEYVEKMLLEADEELKSADDAEIIMSKALWDAIHYNMTVSKGIFIETQWNTLFNGFGKETTWNGYKVVVIPAIDKIIKSVSGNVLSGYPYFAMLTTESNVRFGSMNNKEAGISDIDVWFDKKENVTYAKAIYSLGTQLPQTNMVHLLY